MEPSPGRPVEVTWRSSAPSRSNPFHPRSAPSSLRGVSVTGDLLAQRVRVYDETLAANLPNERRPEHQPQLRGSLDLVRGGAIAAHLDDLYDYMSRRLLEANATNRVELFEEVASLLRELRSAWSAVAGETTARGA